MAFFQIDFRRSAQHDIRRLSSRLLPNILERIENLKDQALPRQSVKLAGTDNLYRLRVGDYRVIYEIDDQKQLIVIYYIRHRRDVYRDLNRRT